MTNPRLIVIAVGAVSFAGGFAVGYKVVEQRLAKEFDQRLDNETSAMKTFYTNVEQKKYATPEEAVQELVLPKAADNALKEYQGRDGTIMYNKVVKSTAEDIMIEGDVDPEEEHAIESEFGHNVFQPQERNADKPYIISQEEFMSNEASFEQATVTWYQKDGKLTDEKDDIIDTIENVVGLDFKVNFGEGSSDPNTVHIRNEALRMDFEIVKSEGSYAEEVMGLDATPIEPPSRRSRGE